MRGASSENAADAATTSRVTKASSSPIAIVLNAVLAVVEDGQPKSLCVKRRDGFALPYGPFDPARHRTFELGLRSWVAEQTRVSLGYVELLYTFGDKGRESPAAVIAGSDSDARVVSVGYLALAPEAAKIAVKDAQWRSWYDFFPWEDWRRGEPAALAKRVRPGLAAWAARSATDKAREDRRARIGAAFGTGDAGWEEDRALERFELMYAPGRVEAAARARAGALSSPAAGLAMMSDHRRILATAIGRLRGKLKYRPVIFELMPAEFTLLSLQRTVEAVVGFELHKQNFRRSVVDSGLVEKTAAVAPQTSGRPAALFRASPATRLDAAASGLAIPRLRLSPASILLDAARTDRS